MNKLLTALLAGASALALSTSVFAGDQNADAQSKDNQTQAQPNATEGKPDQSAADAAHPTATRQPALRIRPKATRRPALRIRPKATRLSAHRIQLTPPISRPQPILRPRTARRTALRTRPIPRKSRSAIRSKATASNSASMRPRRRPARCKQGCYRSLCFPGGPSLTGRPLFDLPDIIANVTGLPGPTTP